MSVLGCYAVGCATRTPALEVDQFRVPGEFEPQASVWLSAEPDDPEFMRVTVEIVRALLPHVAIKMLLPDQDELMRTREILQHHGLSLEATHRGRRVELLFIVRRTTSPTPGRFDCPFWSRRH